MNADAYRRLLISHGVGVILPRLPGVKEMLGELCRSDPEIARMVELGLFKDGDRTLLVLPPDKGALDGFRLAFRVLSFKGAGIGEAAIRTDEVMKRMMTEAELPKPPVAKTRVKPKWPAWSNAMTKSLSRVVNGSTSVSEWLKSNRLKPEDVWDTRFYGQPCLRVKKVGASIIPKGKIDGYEDLTPIFNTLNKAAFGGKLPSYTCVWKDDAGNGRQTAWAHTDHRAHEIVFSKRLWGPYPLGFLWATMYHEMLHVACPAAHPWDGGHHDAFNEKEALFPGYVKWMALDRKMSREIKLHVHGFVPIAKASAEIRKFAGKTFVYEGVTYKVKYWWKKAGVPAVGSVDAKGMVLGSSVEALKKTLGEGDKVRMAANAPRSGKSLSKDGFQHIVFTSLLTGEPIPPQTGGSKKNPGSEPWIVV